jgi:hypothetical protein
MSCLLLDTGVADTALEANDCVVGWPFMVAAGQF